MALGVIGRRCDVDLGLLAGTLARGHTVGTGRILRVVLRRCGRLVGWHLFHRRRLLSHCDAAQAETQDSENDRGKEIPKLHTHIVVEPARLGQHSRNSKELEPIRNAMLATIGLLCTVLSPDVDHLLHLGDHIPGLIFYFDGKRGFALLLAGERGANVGELLIAEAKLGPESSPARLAKTDAGSFVQTM